MQSQPTPLFRLTISRADNRHFDDIVVGSGLSALGAVQGLVTRNRRVLVIGGKSEPSLRHYGFAPKVPCANRGRGGLGEYWHGVIPLNILSRAGYDAEDFNKYLGLFYRSLGSAPLNSDRLFVPWKPIRPNQHFAQLDAQFSRLTVATGTVSGLDPRADSVAVHTTDTTYKAQTVWLAAGTLDTPALLRPHVGGRQVGKVSDHIIGYAGLLERSDEISAKLNVVKRGRDGVFFPCFYNADRSVLYTLRPARFDFASLDEGIEKRAVFGLPTSRAIAGIMGRSSAGLISEALYNKTGLGRNANSYSVYFQTVGRDVYVLDDTGRIESQNTSALEAATRHARETVPFEGVSLSQRPELLIPGIHLHGSLSRQQTDKLSADKTLRDRIRVVDPSVLKDIGPEHHSFRVMFDAYQQASNSE